MSLDTNTKEMKFALDAVQKASKLAQRIQQDMKVIKLTKADTSPVTVADFACQAVVAKTMMEALPDEVLVGEEGADELRKPDNDEMLGVVTDFVTAVIPGASKKSVCEWIDHGASNPGGRFWTLDPIDGTKGYLRGDQYAIALALLEEGAVTLGVLGCPNLGPDCSLEGSGGVLVAAVRGQGTWARGLDDATGFTPLRVSPCDTIADARLLRSLVSSHTNVDQMSEAAEHMGLKAAPVALDSQAKYAMLAAGHGELLFRLMSPKQPDYQECIWDQAAGSIVVEEAGGKITDLAGRPLDFAQGRKLKNNRGVCASNGRLHETAITALGETG